MIPRVLFVCLGNICRSPLAEAAFRQAASQTGLTVHVDSAGTGSDHAGEPPDPRAIAVAARHGVDISGYRARQIRPSDFAAFDWIVGMDTANMKAIAAMRPPDAKTRTMSILDLVEADSGQDIVDPRLGNDDSFAWTWTVVERGAQALLKRLEIADDG